MEKLICQSCGMPMDQEEVLGTNTDGSLNKDYCKFCYDKGAFLQDMTVEQMIDFCVPFVVKEDGMSETAAKEMLQEIMPKLKRWAQ